MGRILQHTGLQVGRRIPIDADTVSNDTNEYN